MAGLTGVTRPRALVVRDFNSDGRLDIAFASQSTNKVGILLGQGEGRFTLSRSFVVGVRPVAIVSGDFNGDGIIDLAVANQASRNISLLFGEGNGTFTGASFFRVGRAPESLAAGDFNGDGRLDLAVACGLTNNVSVLLGQGNGGFAAAASFAAGTSPASIVVGDVNGDGSLDLIVANSNTNTVSVLLGQGTGTFSATAPLQVGSGPRAISLADFNGDGRLDLAVANSFSGDLSVHFGLGDGRFSTATNYRVGVGPAHICTGDFNGDNLIDLAVANFNSANITMLLGGSNGQFTLGGNLPIESGCSFLTAGDFNSDNRIDLVLANLRSSSFSLLVNSCGATAGSGTGTNAPCANLAINPTTLNACTLNQAFNQQLSVAGSNSAVRFAVTAGQLPQGLSLDDTTGLITGQPTVAGTFNFTVTATTGTNCTLSQNFVIVVGSGNAGGNTGNTDNTGTGCSAISLPALTIPAATVGSSFLCGLNAIGANSFTYSATGLPAGLTINASTGQISGIPQAAGTFNFTVTATSGNCVVSQSFTIVVSGGSANNGGTGSAGCTLNVSALGQASATAFTSFTNNLAVSGGTGPYTFSIVGQAPQGITVTNTGVITGVPTQQGTFTFGVLVRDANGCTGQTTINLNVGCSNVGIAPLIINATAGVSFNATLGAGGNAGPFRFVINEQLPAGLTFDGNTGLLSGTLMTSGTVTLTARAIDQLGCQSLNGQVIINVSCPTLTLANPTITVGSNGSVSQALNVTGGSGQYALTVTGGTLGLTLNGNMLTGVATGNGTINVTIRDTLTGCVSNAAVNVITTCPQTPIQLAPINITGSVNTAISPMTIMAGGTISGSIPGLSFNAGTGVIAGTPTQAGNFSVTISGTNALGCSVIQPVNITVGCNTVELPQLEVNGTLEASLVVPTTIINGTVSGTMPGLSFDAAAGAIVGTPNQLGTFQLVITGTNDQGCQITRRVIITVTCPATAKLLEPLVINASVNVAIATAVVIADGTVSGSAPGITYDATFGTITGAPTQSGTFNFTITGTGPKGCPVTQPVTVVVGCPNGGQQETITINAVAGAAINQVVVAADGSVSGSAPGITYNATLGTITGTPTQPGTFNLTITATVNGCTITQPVTVVVTCPNGQQQPITINANVGTPIAQVVVIADATVSGSAPGITYNASLGTITGTPTQTGTFNLTITGTVNGCTITQPITVVVTCPDAVALPPVTITGTVGTAINNTTVLNGTITAGTLPNGLTFSGGVISGTPTQSGDASITITGTNEFGCPVTLLVNIEIDAAPAPACPDVNIVPQEIGNGRVGAAFSAKLTAFVPGQQGEVDFDFSISGNVPGLTASVTGDDEVTIVGTPTTAGEFTLTVVTTVRGTNCSRTDNFLIKIVSTGGGGGNSGGGSGNPSGNGPN